MGSLIRFSVIVGTALAIAGCGLFDAVFATPASCGNDVAAFHRTGTVTCGRITWKLHPRDAQRLGKEAFAYFQKYDAMYEAIRDITGNEPAKPVRILEQCPKDAPFWEDCPNGRLDLYNPMFVRHVNPATQPLLEGLYKATPWIPTWTVYHPEYVTIYVGREFFESVLPRLASDPRHPMYTSLGHEFGHVFGPSNTDPYPYFWDPSFVESFASLWGVDLYVIRQELLGLEQHYWHDGYCRALHGFKNWNCPDVFTFEEFAHPRAYNFIQEYKKANPTGRKVHPYTAELLIHLYRQWYDEGRGKEYFQGLRAVLRYYHQEFRAPRHWKYATDDRTISEKVSLFVYLLSVHTKTDLVDQFTEWGYQFSPAVQTHFMATRREGYKHEVITRYVAMLAPDR
ncbi:hypothetical protein HY622_00455 [Candidatus Uhrbacteria bacterium]|nr:hypothetical protein [Candidatus Uhrbacteria bacterium]